jgi:aspartyl-tRNA(Asn)/glutamyl-tRNA(Gln) amidotransferase subunit A
VLGLIYQPTKVMGATYHYTSISKLGDLIQHQKVSPVEIIDQSLRRIQDLNPKLNAFITVLLKESREQAKIAESEIKAGKWRGPLHGIPVGIKDFYDTAGIKTTAGFQHFKDRIPKKDADGVTRLKNAGAIIIGKMNMHQLGMGTTGLESFFGAIHNPWNMEYIAGGSSGGSAAAVASGLCYATLDTDAIGSCRLPASCCGVVGFKGTYNLISPQGILEGEQPPDNMIQWFSHPGITTRYVEDTAIVLNALYETNNQTGITDFIKVLKNKRSLRVGVANNLQVQHEVREAFDKAVYVVREAGYVTKSFAVPFGDSSGDISNIEADRSTISQKAFSDIDIILLPTTAALVPTIKEVRSNPQGLSPQNTAFANYYGLPAISVPLGFDSHKLPLGLQFVGKPWDDASVLQIAHQYQKLSAVENTHPIG